MKHSVGDKVTVCHRQYFRPPTEQDIISVQTVVHVGAREFKTDDGRRWLNKTDVGVGDQNLVVRHYRPSHDAHVERNALLARASVLLDMYSRSVAPHGLMASMSLDDLRLLADISDRFVAERKARAAEAISGDKR